MPTILILIALAVLSFYFPIAAAIIFGVIVVLNIVAFIAAVAFGSSFLDKLPE